MYNFSDIKISIITGKQRKRKKNPSERGAFKMKLKNSITEKC